MAAFIAKQMVGDKLNSVKGAMGDKDEGDGEKKEETEDGEDPEVAEARREAEERRKEKYRKMEEERETMRQGIRDKYGIKKKVPESEMVETEDPALEGRLGRKKKTPAELAAEANADSDDEQSAGFSFDDIKNKMTELPGSVATSVGGVTEKCVLQ